jgi:sialate O-acetylesterase
MTFGQRSFVPLFVVLTGVLSACQTVHADVRLPGYYSDHMVLQRQMPLRIRGWADVNEKITVQLNGQTATTQATDAGTWQVELPAMEVTREPQTLTVAGNNTVTYTDILIGEVWLCSGQSNMEWRVMSSTNAAEEIAAANYPLIRHVKFDRRPSPVPLKDIAAGWEICSPETAGNFTAVGYFMARKLFQELDVPIGLVNSSWGGTRVEPWVPPVGFERVSALSDLHQQILGRTPGTEQYRNLMTSHVSALEAWLATSKVALEADEIIRANPAFPAALAPLEGRQDPTALYNGMIHGLVGFPIRGAIWYQGESNHVEGMLYYEKKKALINGWRELWGQGDFPFYFVQIAPFQYGNEDPAILAEFWEAQAATTQIPNTGMVVINDIATLNDIHPPNKQDVGYRLALYALKNDYGQKHLIAQSPEFESLAIDGQNLTLTFQRTGGGLKTRDGKAPSHFEITGPGSGGFQPATAVISGDTVTLSSPDVLKPTAFRFAWHKLAEPNLTGGTGLPVGAVRGGEVPTFASQVPELEQYELVYDLNLHRVGSNGVEYDVDNSGKQQAFDRIGYLLELGSSTGEQNVFVSMNAFTDDARKIGVPTAQANVIFQQSVESMNIYSDVNGLTTGEDIAVGNIEFWSTNYGPENGANVPDASSSVYDFGDQPSGAKLGYGSMQIHSTGANQTVFAVNNWKSAAGGDIGIGNSSGKARDWTFSGNAGTYRAKRLRIYVRPTHQ